MDETTIRLHVEPLDEGGYLATSPDVPGLVAEGRTIAETAEIAQGLARKIAESCIDHGDPLPPTLANLVGKKAVDAMQISELLNPTL
jgi:antitoxin HicB